jgi:putative membrane protein
MTEPSTPAPAAPPAGEPPAEPAPAGPPPARPVLHLGQGLLMGSADIIPGVSGGTVALIVGIYERLIEAVRAVTHVPVAVLKGGPSRLRAALLAVEWRFVLPLGIGVVIAIGVGAQFIPELMAAYPEESRALFFGLVAASLMIPWRRAGAVRASGYALAIAAAVLAFVLVGLPAARTADPGMLRVFASAAVAICAMILPGVSGAFLLAVMGIYEPTLIALRSLDVVYVGTFILGAITGLALFARLLGYLLAHHHTTTMVVLVGLLAGSLRALWPWQGTTLVDGEPVATPAILLAPPSATAALVAFAIAAVGFAAVAALAWAGARGTRAAH